MKNESWSTGPLASHGRVSSWPFAMSFFGGWRPWRASSLGDHGIGGLQGTVGNDSDGAVDGADCGAVRDVADGTGDGVTSSADYNGGAHMRFHAYIDDVIIFNSSDVCVAPGERPTCAEP